MLKRTFFCGLIWSVGSLQYIVGGNIHLPFFFATLIIGIVECGLSIHYHRKKGIFLAAILVFQAAYYIAAFVYLLSTEPDNVIRAIGAVAVLCILAFIFSSIIAILKDLRIR